MSELWRLSSWFAERLCQSNCRFTLHLILLQKKKTHTVLDHSLGLVATNNILFLIAVFYLQLCRSWWCTCLSLSIGAGWESSDAAGASSLQVDILWSANTNISCPLFITTNLECLQTFCSLDESKCTARSKASRCFLMIGWRHLQLTSLKTMSINSLIFFLQTWLSISNAHFVLAWLGFWQMIGDQNKP